MVSKDTCKIQVLLSTPYFIPHEDFYNDVPDMMSRDVRVVVLTNSLGSTNHPIVHSGYKKHRKNVLKKGVELFGMRYDATAREKFDTPPARSFWQRVQTRFFGLFYLDDQL